eukprot:1195284-Prorocentrum_minimum.AAC.7
MKVDESGQKWNLRGTVRGAVAVIGGVTHQEREESTFAHFRPLSRVLQLLDDLLTCCSQTRCGPWRQCRVH